MADKDRCWIDNTFALGDLVWAQLRYGSPWPGVILDSKTKRGGNQHALVYRFGCKKYNWVATKNLEFYIPKALDLKKTSNLFRDGISAIEDVHKKGKDSKFYPINTDNTLFDKLQSEASTKSPELSISKAKTSAVSEAKRCRTQHSDAGTSSSGGTSCFNNGSPAPIPRRTMIVNPLLDRPSLASPQMVPLDVDKVSQTGDTLFDRLASKSSTKSPEPSTSKAETSKKKSPEDNESNKSVGAASDVPTISESDKKRRRYPRRGKVGKKSSACEASSEEKVVKSNKRSSTLAVSKAKRCRTQHSNAGTTTSSVRFNNGSPAPIPGRTLTVNSLLDRPSLASPQMVPLDVDKVSQTDDTLFNRLVSKASTKAPQPSTSKAKTPKKKSPEDNKSNKSVGAASDVPTVSESDKKRRRYPRRCKVGKKSSACEASSEEKIVKSNKRSSTLAVSKAKRCRTQHSNAGTTTSSGRFNNGSPAPIPGRTLTVNSLLDRPSLASPQMVPLDVDKVSQTGDTLFNRLVSKASTKSPQPSTSKAKTPKKKSPEDNKSNKSVGAASDVPTVSESDKKRRRYPRRGKVGKKSSACEASPEEKIVKSNKRSSTLAVSKAKRCRTQHSNAGTTTSSGRFNIGSPAPIPGRTLTVNALLDRPSLTSPQMVPLNVAKVSQTDDTLFNRLVSKASTKAPQPSTSKAKTPKKKSPEDNKSNKSVGAASDVPTVSESDKKRRRYPRRCKVGKKSSACEASSEEKIVKSNKRSSTLAVSKAKRCRTQHSNAGTTTSSGRFNNGSPAPIPGRTLTVNSLLDRPSLASPQMVPLDVDKVSQTDDTLFDRLASKSSTKSPEPSTSKAETPKKKSPEDNKSNKSSSVGAASDLPTASESDKKSRKKPRRGKDGKITGACEDSSEEKIVVKSTKRSSAVSEAKSCRTQHSDASTTTPSGGTSRFNNGSPAPIPRQTMTVNPLLDRPASPQMVPLDVAKISQTLLDQNIIPSDLKFGFIGLGNMGSGIVKNLLNSGHHVVIWNRTSDKTKQFIEAGAKVAKTPQDVIKMADIIFSCVSDPQAVKDIMFGYCSILDKINESKGYVEMSTIDAETSKLLLDAVTSRGGTYLEAQLQGSIIEAEEGNLVILSSGEKSLYENCLSCFEAIGRCSFFLGEVGSATKMNLTIQLMSGAFLASFAEAFALADKFGLQLADILEVLALTKLSCPYIQEKGKSIIKRSFTKDHALHLMQKDLGLVIKMSDTVNQPVPLAATANELYKRAKRLGFGDHDSSAVFLGTRF